MSADRPTQRRRRRRSTRVLSLKWHRNRVKLAVEFRSSFSLQSATSAVEESGADARFPYETRHVVVIGNPPESNGVQGVARSNPSVKI